MLFLLTIREIAETISWPARFLDLLYAGPAPKRSSLLPGSIAQAPIAFVRHRGRLYFTLPSLLLFLLRGARAPTVLLCAIDDHGNVGEVVEIVGSVKQLMLSPVTHDDWAVEERV